MWEPAKIASIFILTILSFLSGAFSCLAVRCLVSRFGKSNKFKRTIGVLNCFSGGVFFATCLLDIIPEGREKMEEAKAHWGWDSEYPLSELLVGVGFLSILALESFAHACFRSKQPLTEENKRFDIVPELLETSTKDGDNNQDSSVCNKKANKKANGHGTASLDILKPIPQNSLTDTCSCKPGNDVEIVIESSDKVTVQQNGTMTLPQDVTTAVALKSLADNADNISGQTPVHGIILLFALSFHMIFEGLALGLLTSEGKIWNLLLALALHKSLMFFTIGLQALELLKSVRKTILVVAFLAAISPIGIIIGDIIGSGAEDSVQTSASAILQAIAAGTFIYVTFFEILQREFGHSGHNLWKVLTTVLGFAVVGVLCLLEE